MKIILIFFLLLFQNGLFASENDSIPLIRMSFIVNNSDGTNFYIGCDSINFVIYNKGIVILSNHLFVRGIKDIEVELDYSFQPNEKYKIEVLNNCNNEKIATTNISTKDIVRPTRIIREIFIVSPCFKISFPTIEFKNNSIELTDSLKQDLISVCKILDDHPSIIIMIKYFNESVILTVDRLELITNYITEYNELYRSRIVPKVMRTNLGLVEDTIEFEIISFDYVPPKE